MRRGQPRGKPEPEGEEVGEREEDLSLNRIVFNEDSGFKVPGQYRRLASFVDETDVRFEMLEGLVHLRHDAGSGLSLTGTAGPESREL